MSDTTIQLIIALIAAMSVGGGAVFLLDRRRDDLAADTSTKINQSASDWIDKQESRIDALEERVEELEKERDDAHHATRESERRAGKLQRWITMLEAQVIERGGTPWKLEDIPD